MDNQEGLLLKDEEVSHFLNITKDRSDHHRRQPGCRCRRWPRAGWAAAPGPHPWGPPNFSNCHSPRFNRLTIMNRHMLTASRHAIPSVSALCHTRALLPSLLAVRNLTICDPVGCRAAADDELPPPPRAHSLCLEPVRVVSVFSVSHLPYTRATTISRPSEQASKAGNHFEVLTWVRKCYYQFLSFSTDFFLFWPCIVLISMEVIACRYNTNIGDSINNYTDNVS